MINENILGKRFRSSSPFTNPRISVLTIKYECLELSLSIITYGTTNPQSRPRVLSYFSMLVYLFTTSACLIHSNFLKSKGSEYLSTQVSADTVFGKTAQCLPAGADRLSSAEIQLRAFYPQQLNFSLLELESPRLLVPALQLTHLEILNCSSKARPPSAYTDKIRPSETAYCVRCLQCSCLLCYVIE